RKYPSYDPDDPFDRNSRNNDCNDWRWTMSIWELLGQDERMPDFDLWPGVRITNGLFHTAVKTTRDVIRVTRKSSATEQDLYSISSQAGVDILFDGQITGATLYSGASPVAQMPKQNGVTYEIKLMYEPGTRMGATRAGTRSHFYKYYDKMKANKPRTVYDLFYYDLRK